MNTSGTEQTSEPKSKHIAAVAHHDIGRQTAGGNGDEPSREMTPL